jgi:hypothetical protein
MLRESGSANAGPFRTRDLALKIITIAFLSTCLLAGCDSMLHVNGENAQGIVNERVVGMRLGDFLTRYGAPKARRESNDGAVSFDWDADFAYVGPGPRGTEERICRLRISADRNGRIVSAPILQDGPGKRHLSRCAELFAPA